jgi:Rps23 Pro-64 3,4-dihydroxylase Tpa1-like proline 4-hydroxylase
MDTSNGPSQLSQRLEALMDRAIDTVSSVLDDPTVPAPLRADLALRLLELTGEHEPGNIPSPPLSGLLPPRCFAIPDFLELELHDGAVDIALRMREQFVASSVTGGEDGYRQSTVLYDGLFPALRDAFQRRVIECLPAVFTALAFPAFHPSRFEVQMTSHGDGDFFRVHSDAAAPETDKRVVSFVYYFSVLRPASFDGGTLRLYQTALDTPQRYEAEIFKDVVPADNMAVFFDSRLMHEVLSTRVPSRAFEDGRFTLNGWLHR